MALPVLFAPYLDVFLSVLCAAWKKLVSSFMNRAAFLRKVLFMREQ